MDDSSGEKCEPVIVFECMDLSIGQRIWGAVLLFIPYLWISKIHFWISIIHFWISKNELWISLII